MSELILIMRSAVALPLEWLGLSRASATERVRVSDGRLYALDLARFVAMVFMMQGHVIDALAVRTELVLTEFPWNVWHVIRGFTAPIFLMVSGAVHAFATKREKDGRVREDVLNKRIRWAFTIMGIGYFMMFPASSVWDLPYVPQPVWNGFLAVNILHLTGVTILLLAVIASSTRSVHQLGQRALITAVVIVLATPLMQHLAVLNDMPAFIRAYVNTSTGSLFPIFPFSAYFFVGLFIGSRLAVAPAATRDSVLMRMGWRYGSVIALAGLALQAGLVMAGVSNAELEGPMSIPLFIRRVGVVLVVFSTAVWVLERTWSLRKWYTVFGTKSLWIYVIHLVLLFGTPWVSSIGRTHYHSLSIGASMVAALCIIVLTLAMAWLFDWCARQPWAATWKQRFMWAAYAVVGLILVI